MSTAARKVLFAISVLGLFALYCWGTRGLPAIGHYAGPYGDVLNSLAVYARHATDVVTAVNFDYRGIDTLGEEFILFGSVVGVLLLLRRQKDEKKDESHQHEEMRTAPDTSDAVRVLTLALVAPLVLFGVYVVIHGQLTPGGGFQGGVVLATAPLLVYLAGNLDEFKRITQPTLVEITEAVGAGGFALVGLAGVLTGAHFLQNILPFGKTGNVNSSGTILLISVLTGLEVAAGFVLALHAFLEHALEIQSGGGKQ